jgi:hypothetical protein
MARKPTRYETRILALAEIPRRLDATVDALKATLPSLRQLLDAHLARVKWDKDRVPVRLHPFLVSGTATAMPIAIDPGISFGRPIVAARGISTAAIAARIDAGEQPSDVAAD